MALAVPAASLAQQVSPTETEYGTPVLDVGASGEPNDPGDPAKPAEPVSSADVDTLPFTGLDVAAIAAIGIGLLGAGFVIRRAARPGRQS